MPAANSKANYRTYEAQARMVRAIVAAHPEVKWNYKDIVACYGSDMTEHALNHRFRRLRAQSIIIREARVKGLDMKNLPPDGDLPATQEAVDKKNIAKYFGQSTADGIQFQFRGIKKDADRLRRVEQDGGDVANCLSLGTASGSVFSTPSKPTPSRGSGSRTGTGGGRKRTRIPEIKRTSSDEDEDDEIDDIDSWTDREETPSKRPKVITAVAAAAGGAFSGQKNGTTPSRRAAVKANITIAEAAATLESTSSDEQPDFDTPTQKSVFALPTPTANPFTTNNNTTAASTATVQHHRPPITHAPPQSIFGYPEQKPIVHQQQQHHQNESRNGGIGGYRSSAFTPNAPDPYLTGGGGSSNSQSYGNYYDDLGDGEI